MSLIDQHFASLRRLCYRFAFCVVATLALPLQAAPRIEHWTTASGSAVYFIASPALPMLDIRVDFPAGSAYDPVGKAGLAALTHTLLDQGAGPDDEANVARKLADLGAQLSGSLDTDRAGLSLRTLSQPEIRSAALSILSNVLSQPHFEEAALVRERTRTIAGLKDALTRPDTLASRTFWSTLYGEHPYGQLTTPDSLEALERKDVQAFFRRHYLAKAAVITLVGDLKRTEAEAIAEALSATLATPPETTAPAAVIPPVVRGSGKTVTLPHSAQQSHLLLGLPLIERGHPDFFPLLVGNYTLGGGGFVSRLMQEVREKRGYAYSVYSTLSLLKQPGPFQIGLQTRKSQAAAALSLTRQVLDRFLAEGPSATELAAAKANLVGSFPLRLDSNKKLLDNVAAIGFYKLPLDWLDQYAARITAVSREDIRAAFARAQIVERLNVVQVGTEE